jgi:hypothetical protein
MTRRPLRHYPPPPVAAADLALMLRFVTTLNLGATVVKDQVSIAGKAQALTLRV